MATLFLSFSLCGCFISKEALFDPSGAVMPFAAGKYKLERYRESTWVSEDVWDIKAKENGYYFDDNSGSRTSFRLFELDRDLYIIEGIMHQEYNYALARVTDGAILIEFTDCASFKLLDAAQSNPPSEERPGWVLSCYYDENTKLFAALSASRDKTILFARLTPVYEVATAKPAPQPPAVAMTSLTFCNKGSNDLSAIVHHQHRFNADKGMLTGWFDIPKGQCRDLGKFARKDLSLYAMSAQGGVETPGTSKTFCVSQRRTYRAVRDNEQCVQGEAAKQFTAINATSDTVTYAIK